MLLASSAIALAGGCATAPRSATSAHELHGYADLNVLVRSHPGWAGLARYDEAIARVNAASLQPLASADTDTNLVSLPAASVSARALSSTVALKGERKRLDAVLVAQVARLRDRQAAARDRQINIDQPRWEREAAAQFESAVAVAEKNYSDELSRLAVDSDARRVNLVLQIRALKEIVGGWDKSTPPTPELNQARADLVTKRAQLLGLDKIRRQQVATADAERQSAISAATSRKKAYLAAMISDERATLLARDEEQVAVLHTRLGDELSDLLHQEETLSVPSVAPVGSLGAQTMPAQAKIATVSPGAAQSLRVTQSYLKQQRARWLDYIYSDTRAAVKDVAERKHWIVSFGRPSLGESNLTAPLAQALTARVWKS